MERIFKNDDLQKRFEIFGYVTVPFLSKEEVLHLSNTFQSTFTEVPEGFYSTSFSKNEEAKSTLISAIDTVFEDKVSVITAAHRKLGSCFLTKSPGVQGEMPIHQDWTVVDESRFQSVTIWVPLCDVDDKNGAMQVLDGSHRFSDALRAPTLDDVFGEVQNEIRKDLKNIPMKAGEALIFSQALLHASPANLSNQRRDVITFGFIPQKAKLLYYYKNDADKVEKYDVPDNFFGEYNTDIGIRPTTGIKVDEFTYNTQKVSVADYRQMQHTFLKRKSDMYKMMPIFRDEERQRFFEKEGYIVLPLLNETEIEDLKQFYTSLNIKDEKGFGFHVSMDQTDKEMCRVVREKIWSVVLPKLDEHLKDFKPFVASFVVKDPNPKGVVPAHQDWTFTDGEDDGFASITCWTTLVETSINNGGMGVIKGSHKLMQNPRPSPSPQTPVPLGEHMFSIFPYLKTIDMKPGEVLMFDNRTFHASPPNTTDDIRLAVGVGVTQKDARLIHYYLKPDGLKSTMLKYAVDEDFFLKYNNAELARIHEKGELIQGYELLAELPYRFPTFTSPELVELIKEKGNEFNVPMCEKLSQLFGYNMDGSKQEEVVPEQVVVEESNNNVWVDDRGFFQKYTPLNIVREIKKRVVGV